MRRVVDLIRVWLLDIFVNGVGGSRVIPRHARWAYLRLLGYDIKPCVIAAGGYIGGRRLHIGARAFLNDGVFLDTADHITIGARVSVGMQAMIVTGSHEIGGPEKRAGHDRPAPVVIGDGAWIGARALILPGVTVGPGAVIAAGAVVTADCDPHTVYAGSPARAVRKLKAD